jgi:intracellular septation protein A
MTQMMTHTQGFSFWTYRRPFMLDNRSALVVMKATSKGLFSTLSLDGMELCYDFTPLFTSEALRNHDLTVTLPDGRMLSVEAGYCSMTNAAIAVRLDGKLIHESHPGVAIKYPEKAARQILKAEHEKSLETIDPAVDFSRLTANRLPIFVDIVTGLLFFVVAKATDLTTAALTGAAVGIALIIIQWRTKLDLLGGLAKFGIIMLLISAGFAYAFQDDAMVKMRSTIVGLIGAAAFLSDGLIGGRWLGEPMSRYMVYTDIMPRRLAIGLGLVGLTMAALNWLVAFSFSTDVWLFYTTFVDIVVSMMLILMVIRWARGLSVVSWR